MFGKSVCLAVGQSVGLSVVRSVSPLVRSSFGLSSVGLSLCQLSLSLPFCQSAGWLVCRSAVVRQSVGQPAGWLISQRVSMSVDWPVSWSCSRSVSRSVVGLLWFAVGLSVGRLVTLSVCPSVCKLVDCRSFGQWSS